MDILQEAGAMALGSRFRRLSERLVNQASEVYQAYNVPMEPGWFPVMYCLMDKGEATVTGIAECTGQSHPFISKTVKQMKEAGLVVTRSAANDKRVQQLRLTMAGKQMLPALTRQMDDIGNALTQSLNSIAPDFLLQLEAVEKLLSRATLLSLIQEMKMRTTQAAFSVVPYFLACQDAFYQLNKAWIDKYFKMEASDYHSLGDPKSYILDKGGEVLLALDHTGEVCGSVALIPMANDCFELAKMAVAESAQRKGLGFLLGQTAINKAREKGAKRLYLESNRKLVAALTLYHKLGFEELTDAVPSPYARCDIQMELIL